MHIEVLIRDPTNLPPESVWLDPHPRLAQVAGRVRARNG